MPRMQHITPDMVEASYRYMLTTLPFRRWKLPHPDTIRFRVMATKDRFGHWLGEAKTETVGELAISMGKTDSTTELHRTVAHEMIHIRLQQIRKQDGGSGHGKNFKKLSRIVCRRHGWTTVGF